MEQHNPTYNWAARIITFSSDTCRKECLPGAQPVVATCLQDRRCSYETFRPENTVDIATISAEAAVRFTRRDPDSATWILPEEWDRLDESSDNDEYCAFISLFEDCAAVTEADFKKFRSKLERKPYTKDELRARLPEQFHHLVDLWDPKEAAELPKRRAGVDHEIHLKEGSQPTFQRYFGTSREEAEAIRAYVQTELDKGYIRESKSPFTAPLLVVKKPGGGIRICVDYRKLNEITTKDRNAPPKISETLSRMNKVRLFSKFDIIAAFNKIRIKEGDEYKTAFSTRFGLFEYLIMPFGLCNAPGTFQRYINQLLRDFLDDFCSAYLDDILVYSENEADHMDHCPKVCERLLEAGLHLDIDKCEFSVKRVSYLGMILSTEGLEMEPSKIKTILDWALPQTVKDIQAFIGFANFYRRFIHRFSQIVRPLIELTRGATGRVELTEESTAAFHQLQKAFTSAPVLAHFNPEARTIIETNASDWVVAGILSQQLEGVLRPIAYFSMKMKPAELNYPIYDKELMAIIRAFEEWRPELAGTADPIEVFSDHKALEYFMTTKQLNRRQARWAEFLSEFNFVIRYRPGKQGTKPDALTRRSADLPTGLDDERISQQQQVLLAPNQFEMNVHPGHDGGTQHAVFLARIITEQMEMNVQEISEKVYATSEELFVPDGQGEDDPLNLQEGPGDADHGDLTGWLKTFSLHDEVILAVAEALDTGARRLPHRIYHGLGLRLELQDCEIRDNLLYVNGRIFIPYNNALRTRIIQLFHDPPIGGHASKHETYYRLSKYYYWPRCTNNVAQYIRNCFICARAKSKREGKQGLLHPLPIPNIY